MQPPITSAVTRLYKDKDSQRDADSRKYFGGMSQEELHRRKAAARIKYKTLQAAAKQIGAELVVTEYYDEVTGECCTVTKDELLLRNFLNKLIKRPTPQGLLAWQKLKGEDVIKIAPADRLDDKTADELKNELQGVLSALNNLPTRPAAASPKTRQAETEAANDNGGSTDGNPSDQPNTGSNSKNTEAFKNTAVDIETGEQIEISEVAENKPTRPPLPWLLR